MKVPHGKALFLAGRKALVAGNRRLQKARSIASKRNAGKTVQVAPQALPEQHPPLILVPLTEEELKHYKEVAENLPLIVEFQTLAILTGRVHINNKGGELFPLTTEDIEQNITEKKYKKAFNSAKFQAFLFWQKEEEALRVAGKDYRELEILKKTSLANIAPLFGAEDSTTTEPATPPVQQEESNKNNALIATEEKVNKVLAKSKTPYFLLPNILKQQLANIAKQFNAKEAVLNVCSQQDAGALINTSGLFEGVLAFFSQCLSEDCSATGAKLNTYANKIAPAGEDIASGVISTEDMFKGLGKATPVYTVPVTFELADLCRYYYGEDQTYYRTIMKNAIKVITKTGVVLKGINGKLENEINIVLSTAKEEETKKGCRDRYQIVLTPIFTALATGFTEVPTSASERIRPFCNSIRDGYKFPAGEATLFMQYLSTKRNGWSISNKKLLKANKALLPKCNVRVEAKGLASTLGLEKYWQKNPADASRRVEELLMLFEQAGVIKIVELLRSTTRRGALVLSEVSLSIKEAFWTGGAVIETEATNSQNAQQALPEPATGVGGASKKLSI